MLRLEERIAFDGAMMFDLALSLGEETPYDLSGGRPFNPPSTTEFEQEALERRNLINSLNLGKRPPMEELPLSEAFTVTETTRSNVEEFIYYPTGLSMGSIWLKTLQSWTSKIDRLHKHSPFGSNLAVRFSKPIPASLFPIIE